MGAPVMLNVYDLTPYNSYVYFCGVGIFHAGVEVFGIEYAFGGHDYDYSGVFATNPRDAPGQVVFRESVYMGETDLSPGEVQQLVQKMGQEFKGCRYHLLQRNCNHFANDLVYQLVGKRAPAWINRLAGLAISLHCLLPTTWVPPLQIPSEEHNMLITGPRSDRYLVNEQRGQSVLVTPPTAVNAGMLANR